MTSTARELHRLRKQVHNHRLRLHALQSKADREVYFADFHLRASLGLNTPSHPCAPSLQPSGTERQIWQLFLSSNKRIQNGNTPGEHTSRELIRLLLAYLHGRDIAAEGPPTPILDSVDVMDIDSDGRPQVDDDAESEVDTVAPKPIRKRATPKRKQAAGALCVCLLCDSRTLANQSSLTRHKLRRHVATGAFTAAFPCPACYSDGRHIEFCSGAPSWSAHVAQYHRGYGVPHLLWRQCNYFCGAQFDILDQALSHVKEEHGFGKEGRCCEQTFKSAKQLKTHLGEARLTRPF